MPRASSFRDRVIAVVGKIPAGKTMTYGEVATKAGNAKAARAVGTIMNRYGIHVTGIPCHRVVRSDGSVGGYRFGAEEKRQLLKKEGALK
jgi:O-6-methylguanine DNA methyltransferase